MDYLCFDCYYFAAKEISENFSLANFCAGSQAEQNRTEMTQFNDLIRPLVCELSASLLGLFRFGCDPPKAPKSKSTQSFTLSPSQTCANLCPKQNTCAMMTEALSLSLSHTQSQPNVRPTKSTTNNLVRVVVEAVVIVVVAVVSEGKVCSEAFPFNVYLMFASQLSLSGALLSDPNLPL